MKPQVVPEASLTESQDAAIRAGLCACFPDDRETFSRSRAWHGSLPDWSVLVEREGAVVAHAGTVEREILVGRRRVRVAGVQNVFVVPEFRGTGLFRQVMTTVLEEARRRGLEFGLLFCVPEIGRKYARQGWRLLEGRSVTRIDEQGNPQPLPPKNEAMYFPLAGGDMPSGDLNLLGNDW